MTTITSRISGAASGGQTSRVSGAVTEGTSRRITGAASGGQTARVSGAASGGDTERFEFKHYFVLEGDEDGKLLLEGDMQSGTDALLLEGDEAVDLTNSHTRRVTL